MKLPGILALFPLLCFAAGADAGAGIATPAPQERRPYLVTPSDELITSLGFSPDGSRLTTAGIDRTLRHYRLDGREVVQEKAGERVAATAYNSGAPGKLAWSTFDGKVIVRTLAEPGKSASADVEIPLPNPKARLALALEFLPGSGDRLACAYFDGSVGFWELAPRPKFKELYHYDQVVRTVAFSADGRWFATGARDTAATLRDAGGKDHSLSGHTGGLTSAVFVGKEPRLYLATASKEDNTLRLWNCAAVAAGMSAQPEKTLSFPDRPRALARGQVGAVEYLAVGCADGTLSLWNTQDWSCVRALRAHHNKINAVEFTPDGQFLASGSDDKTARVWRLVDVLAVSPDGVEGDLQKQLFTIEESHKRVTTDLTKERDELRRVNFERGQMLAESLARSQEDRRALMVAEKMRVSDAAQITQLGMDKAALIIGQEAQKKRADAAEAELGRLRGQLASSTGLPTSPVDPLAAAEKLLQENRPQLALLSIRAALSVPEASREARVRAADLLTRAGHPAEAARVYLSLLKAAPDPALDERLRPLVASFGKRKPSASKKGAAVKDPDPAIEKACEAVVKERDAVEPRLVLAQAYLETHHYRLALQEAADALTLKADHPEALRLRGDATKALEAAAKKESDLRMAVVSPGGDPAAALLALGRFLEEERRPAEATACFTAAMAHFTRRGEFAPARDAFLQAARLESGLLPERREFDALLKGPKK